MKPDVPEVLRAIAALLDAQSDPQACSAYDADSLGRAAGLLRIVADGFDDAVAWRVEELRAWCVLFAEAAPAVGDPALSAALASAAAGSAAAGAAGEPASAAPTGDPSRAARASAPQSIDALPAGALRVSALDVRLDALRALADELLAWSEGAGTPAAEAIGRAVWDALRRGTERRRVTGARF